MKPIIFPVLKPHWGMFGRRRSYYPVATAFKWHAWRKVSLDGGHFLLTRELGIAIMGERRREEP